VIDERAAHGLHGGRGMKTRFLGRERLALSAIGYGCPPFQGRLAPDEEKRAIRVLERAVELGVTYIDTADHNNGNNEELLAPFLKRRRDAVLLSTKFGNRKGYPGEEARPADGRPEKVAHYVEASLKRLATDRIDLLYFHRVDPRVPIEDTVGAMKRMVEQGKVRHLGLSEAGPETLARANAVHPIAAVQSEYSLMTRDYEADTLPACRALGIGYVAYYPTGRGFLAGRFRSLDELGAKDNRRTSPRFRDGNMARNLELLDALAAMAEAKGCTTSQLALAWVLAQGDFIVPIPGTMRIEHLEENVAAASLALAPDELAALDRLFAPSAVAGGRFAGDRSKELNI
jgi:aryl-alcohol dehydrogenase-like predicted oxidoreductase